MRKNILVLLPCLIFIGCNNKTSSENNSRETAIEEIRKAETDFEAMVKSKGIAEGFSFFADSNAVIKRQNDSLIHGKQGIQNYYNGSVFNNATVTWKADFIDASGKGDMGYTYGNYTWVATDSTGKTSTFKGVFHTVWKKQADGSWKYVWD